MTELKEQIEKLIEQYNNALTPGERRLVLESHGFFCRCPTCWYKHGGKERDTIYGRPVPYGKYPTDKQLENLNKEREKMGLEPLKEGL